MTKLERTLESLLDSFILRLPSLLLAIITLLVGLWLLKFLLRFITRRFTASKMDSSLSYFLVSIIKAALYILLLLTVASTLGIQTSSFVAILGAAGLAVGLALQGSLSNFAGGVLILLFKPFKVGHSISAANGVSGTVLKIDILYTTLKAGNGTTLYAPNGPLANAVINNTSDNENRMLEYVIAIAYTSNIDTARKVILKVLTDEALLLIQPAPVVHVTSLADNAIYLTVQGWVKNSDYGKTYHKNYQLIKEALDANHIANSSPQRDIHLVSGSNPALLS